MPVDTVSSSPAGAPFRSVVRSPIPFNNSDQIAGLPVARLETDARHVSRAVHESQSDARFHEGGTSMSDLEQQPDLGQRRFLKRLAGTAAGVVGFAAASRVLSPPSAEAAYSPGTAPDGGDLVNTNLWVQGNTTIQGPRPWIDVRAYGAKGDGSTIDTVAIQNAFNAIPFPGGQIFFPAGLYRLNAPITVNDSRSVHVVGAGRGVTALQWDAGSPGGLHFTFHQVWNRLTMHSLALATHASNGDVAIKASWPTWTDGRGPSPHLYDLHILPIPGSAGYWTKGIELTNAAGAKIHDFDIWGTHDVSMSHGIHLLGSSTITFIGAGFILAAGKGIEVGGISEGLYLRDIEAVHTTTGYEIGSVSPGTSITNCHAASDLRGIFIWGHGEVALTGNLLYQNGDNPNGYVGIYLANSQFHRVIGNEVASTNPGGVQPRNGILLHDTHNCTVQGNVVRDMNSAVWLLGGNTNIVMGNRGVNCGSVVANAGAGNLVVNNL
jgi:parallel beta-helix repeat protein